MSLRVIVTGGSGRAGRYVLQTLIARGHKILNLDLANADNPDVHTIKCDITDSGQVFSCLNSHMKLAEPFPAERPRVPDAVIHFAALSTPMMVSDGETFRTNVMGTHNVVEAACKMGVKKIILASSVTTYGVSFGQGKQDYPAFPVEEHLDVNPTDPYALSKLVGERVARSYAARYGVDIYCLRIGRVVDPSEYQEIFPEYVSGGPRAHTHGFSYVDSRDLGEMCQKALEVNGLGWQVFNATNDSITNTTPTKEFLAKNCPHVPITREMDEFEAPISNRKIRRLLGFEQAHHWQRYYRISKDSNTALANPTDH